ncbi:MAG TPA: rod shape-determining protein MreD [Humisphaera sp.]
MRWLPFFILAYVVLGVQVGLGGFVSVKGATPSLVLGLVVFACTNAPREQALLASFVLGLSQDLLTVDQPIGLYAMSYGLSGLIVVAARKVAYADHPLTHFFLALAGGLTTAVVLTVHAWVRPATAASTGVDGLLLPAVGPDKGPLYLSAVLTAVAAPFLIWALKKFRPVLGIQRGRPRY